MSSCTGTRRTARTHIHARTLARQHACTQLKQHFNRITWRKANLCLAQATGNGRTTTTTTTTTATTSTTSTGFSVFHQHAIVALHVATSFRILVTDNHHEARTHKDTRLRETLRWSALAMARARARAHPCVRVCFRKNTPASRIAIFSGKYLLRCCRRRYNRRSAPHRV